jgi:hypothetical protein
MKLALRLLAAIVLAALCFLALERTVNAGIDSDIPPDLAHVSQTGCSINQHLEDVLDAQAKAIRETESWQVEAFARYEATPEGEKRDNWTHSLGTVPTMKDATDLCDPWLKRVKRAIIDEHHKLGHTLKSDHRK